MTSTSGRPIPVPAAAFHQDRPVGLFHRLKVDLMGGGRLEVRTLLFLDGGRISRVFPYGGAFDPSRCSPDTCGSCAHAPGEIAIRWDDGRVDRWTYARTAEGFDLDGDSYKPARPVSPADLAGRWAGAGSPGVPGENVYAFGPDGAFTFGAGAGGVGGRYRLDGLAIVLDFADGTRSARTLFAAGSGAPVGLICVEGDAYRRQ